LIRRHADQPPKDAQKVVLAQTRNRRETRKINGVIWMLLDRAHDFDHAPRLPPRRRRRRPRAVVQLGDNRLDQSNEQALGPKGRLAVAQVFNRCKQRRQPVRRRKHRAAERILSRRRCDRGDVLESVLSHVERYTAIARAVLVPTLVA